jgi:AcrR family transcriptional regulator
VTGAEADRQRALAAARLVMARSGIWGIKVETVIAESGLSNRAFYRCFSDKHDLLRAVIEEHYRDLAEGSRRIFRDAVTPIEGLREWIEMMTALADPRSAGLTAALTRHWQEVRLAYPEAVEAAVDEVHQLLAEQLRAVRDMGYPHIRPTLDAGVLYLLTRAVMQQQVIGRPPVNLELARRLVWPIIYRSLLLDVLEEPAPPEPPQ